MSHIDILHAHSMSPAQARLAVQDIADTLARRFGVPVIFYDGDVPMSLPEFGGMDTGFNYYHGADPSEYVLVVSNSEGSVTSPAATATALLRLAPALLRAGHAVAAADALPLYIRDKVAQTTQEREAAREAKAALRTSP